MKNFIGYNLKLARISHKLSVKNLADKLGISRQEIHNYEKERRSPNFSNLRKLSVILDKHHLYFFRPLDNHFTKNDPYIFYCKK